MLLFVTYVYLIDFLTGMGMMAGMSMPVSMSSSSGMSSMSMPREERKRKRKSRWEGDDTEKVFIPGLPTILPANLTPHQEQIYLCKSSSEVSACC